LALSYHPAYVVAFHQQLHQRDTHPQEIAGHVALLAAGIPGPPPLVLGVVALAQHDQRLVHVEGELVAVLGLVGEHGVHVPIVQDAQLLLDACE